MDRYLDILRIASYIFMMVAISYVIGHKHGADKCMTQHHLVQIDCPKNFIPLRTRGEKGWVWGCWTDEGNSK